MVSDLQNFLEEMARLADSEDLRVTLNQSLRYGLIGGALIFIGGMVAGRRGILLGGAIGGAAGYLYGTGKESVSIFSFFELMELIFLRLHRNSFSGRHHKKRFDPAA